MCLPERLSFRWVRVLAVSGVLGLDRPVLFVDYDLSEALVLSQLLCSLDRLRFRFVAVRSP